MKNYLGVDIGGTTVKLGIVSENGDLRFGPKEYSVSFDGYKTPILDTVIRSCGLVLADAGIPVDGIGVSSTGGINTRMGTVDGAVDHLPGYKGTDLKGGLEAEFHVPVRVLNDANAAALGEMWIGAAKGRRDVVVVTIGTGVGGGIVTDGHILLGRRGFAGEVGHIPIDISGEPCYCGSVGCFEQVGSTTALIREVTRATEAGEVRLDCEINGRTIFAAAKDGNEVVRAILEKWIFRIAEGIVGLVHTFDPEMVLIGGGVSAQKELFIDRVRDRVLALAMSEFAEGLEIRAAQLGNDAGLYGAVKYLMQETE